MVGRLQSTSPQITLRTGISSLTGAPGLPWGGCCHGAAVWLARLLRVVICATMAGCTCGLHEGCEEEEEARPDRGDQAKQDL